MNHRRRVYLSLGKIAAPMALLGLKLYTKMTNRPRVRVLVENEKGEILLIRNVLSRSNSWMFPGGGVGRMETLIEAASRELHEETGIQKPLTQFIFLKLVPKKEIGLSFDAPLFRVRAKKGDLPQKLHNPNEIADAQWFPKANLPTETSRLVRYTINELNDIPLNRPHKIVQQ